eukprot:m.155583 g.155583  ORF g.155583 m.155583 type:complete len:59 (+) comp23572_c0_seq1:2105-2281(+)
MRPTAKVTINADKPGKGNFVVCVGQTEVVALTAMPRPFKKLRELDLDEVAEKVAAALG